MAQLSICRYVSASSPPTSPSRKEFLQFHPVVKCTGQLLGEKIIERVSQLGLDIQKCRGQGYDGAAAMSSDRVGAQKVVRDVAPISSVCTLRITLLELGHCTLIGGGEEGNQ